LKSPPRRSGSDTSLLNETLVMVDASVPGRFTALETDTQLLRDWIMMNIPGVVLIGRYKEGVRSVAVEEIPSGARTRVDNFGGAEPA
jgi:hypothetical protein